MSAARILWDIERHTRHQVAARLGVHYDHMDALCNVYCEGRRLLSDEDVEVLRNRRPRGKRRPTPDEIRAKVRATGPSEEA